MEIFRLYGHVAGLAARRAIKAWPVAFSLFFYVAILTVAEMLVRPLGMGGGILLTLVMAACVSSYLHLLAQSLSGSRLVFDDLRRGFAVYFWDVISVLFALWIIALVVTMLVRGAGSQAAFLQAAVGLLMAVFFNPVPELIYQGSSRSFRLLGDSARFISAHWIEWFVPNLLFAALLLGPVGALRVTHPGELVLLFTQLFSLRGIEQLLAGLPWAFIPLLLVVIHFAMIFRGLLFTELKSGNARQRAFRSRMR